MFFDVTSAEHAGDYRIRLRFRDGSGGVADLSAYAGQEHAFRAFRDPEYFKAFRLEYGTLVGALPMRRIALKPCTRGPPAGPCGTTARRRRFDRRDRFRTVPGGAVEQPHGAVVHFCRHLHPGCGQRHRRLPWRPGTQLMRTLGVKEGSSTTLSRLSFGPPV